MELVTEDVDGLKLPGAWTDLSHGIMRQQVDNLLQFNAVTAYFDGQPVAVILSVKEYGRLYEQAFGSGGE